MAMNFMSTPRDAGFLDMGFALMMWRVGAALHSGGTCPDVGVFGRYPRAHPKYFGHTGCSEWRLLRCRVFTLSCLRWSSMDTAVTIPTGALADAGMGVVRLLLFLHVDMGISYIRQLGMGVVVVAIGYVSSVWATACGLRRLLVVHMVAVWLLSWEPLCRPRIGKYGKDGKVNAIPGHHMPDGHPGRIHFASLVWFQRGLITLRYDLRISVIALNTMLASGAARSRQCWSPRSVSESLISV